MIFKTLNTKPLKKRSHSTNSSKKEANKTFLHNRQNPQNCTHLLIHTASPHLTISIGSNEMVTKQTT